MKKLLINANRLFMRWFVVALSFVAVAFFGALENWPLTATWFCVGWYSWLHVVMCDEMERLKKDVATLLDSLNKAEGCISELLYESQLLERRMLEMSAARDRAGEH